MTDWNQIRNKFRAFDEAIYINTAATGLVPDNLRERMAAHYLEHASLGAAAAESWVPKMEKVRADVAEFFNADPFEIAFVPNMSTGLNWIADMLRGQGKVAYPNGDFPSLHTPFEFHGFPMEEIPVEPNGFFSYDQIKKAQAEIVALSHVQWHTGFKIDPVKVRKECLDDDQIYILDATQSGGTCKIDVKEIGVDIMLVSCYKWMLNGFGNCVVFVKKELLEKFPSKHCWQYRAWDQGGVFASARRFEIGHERAESFFRMEEGLSVINEIGISNIEIRLKDLSAYLYQKAKDAGIKIISDYAPEFRSQIAILDGSNEDRIALLNEGIHVSHRGTGIRVSPHFYNNKNDIDILISKLVKLKNKSESPSVILQ